MNPTLGQALTTKTLEMALGPRSPDEGLIYHSDRGYHYASGNQQEILASHQILGSMAVGATALTTRRWRASSLR